MANMYDTSELDRVPEINPEWPLLDREGWTADADSFEKTGIIAQNVLDGKITTYWHSAFYDSSAKYKGYDVNPPKDWKGLPCNLWVDTKSIHRINKITLGRRFLENRVWDELGAFNLYRSMDAEEWTLITSHDIGSSSDLEIIECSFLPVTTRYLRIESIRSNRKHDNGRDSQISYISELNVYGIKL